VPDRDAWTLVDFVEKLDAWIALEDPPQDLILTVGGWIFTRAETPYKGVRRQEGFDNLWSGAVPQSGHGDGMAVACAYWIEETEQRVRCESFASLSQPIW
jgi:hypothetical protein